MKTPFFATLSGLAGIVILASLLYALTASSHRGSGRAEMDGRYYSSDAEETDKKRDPRPKVAHEEPPYPGEQDRREF